jgi:hypothetical protein
LLAHSGFKQVTGDPGVVPGILILAAQLLSLAALGYVVARSALRQTDDRLALAQGLVIGPALWGLIVNFVLHVLPGLAGALAGWLIVLALGTGLAWRWRTRLQLQGRTLAGFAGAGTAIFWIALASRQLLIIPDHILHTMMPATIRAGGWPLTLGWNPDLELAYHHGIDLLVGLLTPPAGPDLAFTTELLGAYAWTSLTLLTGSLLLRRGSSAGILALMPLLLAPGAWTLVFGEQPFLLKFPIPVDMPVAGVRAALAEMYWPAVELPWGSEQQGVPPNIWKPAFALSYCLAIVVLERVAAGAHRLRIGALTLAALVGFLGLLDETVAPVVLGMWIVVAAAGVYQARPKRSQYPAAVLDATSGPLLAVALLLASGGVFTGILTGSSGSGELTLGWPLDPRTRAAVSSVASLDAGLGLVSLGSLIVAGLAIFIDRRNQLVVLLVAATGVFLLAALVLRYDVAPHDIGRFDGHARNFALLALLIALSARLGTLRQRWRYAAAAFILILITWPTVATEARKLGLAIGHGVQIANATPESRTFDEFYWWMGRYPQEQFPSDPIANWIHHHADVDARILSPAPYALTVATGRPNASGFAEFLHTRPYTGSGYLDALRQLEPSALRRLGIEYVHASDDWTANLPARATRWLADPRFFQPLIRDGAHTLFRVQPSFLALDVPPAPESFEALREAIPAGSSVYLSPANGSLNTFRAVAALPRARLLGSPNRAALHLQANIPTTPIGNQTADFVVAAVQLAPSMFQPDTRRPVFWNEEIAVYSPNRAIAPVQDPPPRPFTVRVTDAQETDGRLLFTATLSDTTGEGWTGQDWLVVPADESPWALPRIRPTDPAAQWYAGQAVPRPETVTHRYEFDPQSVRLSLEDSQPDAVRLDSSGDQLDPGVWILAVRLRSEYQLAGFIPVAKVLVTESGNVSYEAYEGEYGVKPSPRPSEP